VPRPPPTACRFRERGTVEKSCSSESVLPRSRARPRCGCQARVAPRLKNVSFSRPAQPPGPEPRPHLPVPLGRSLGGIPALADGTATVSAREVTRGPPAGVRVDSSAASAAKAAGIITRASRSTPGAVRQKLWPCPPYPTARGHPRLSPALPRPNHFQPRAPAGRRRKRRLTSPRRPARRKSRAASLVCPATCPGSRALPSGMTRGQVSAAVEALSSVLAAAGSGHEPFPPSARGVQEGARQARPPPMHSSPGEPSAPLARPHPDVWRSYWQPACPRVRTKRLPALPGPHGRR